MNFVKSDIAALLKESKSRSTVDKTTRDVQYFQEFLLTIECIDVPMKDLAQEDLIKHMCTFFNGVKKRKDGGDYEPTSLWSMFASLKRHLTEVSYSFKGSQPITQALAPVTEVLKAVSRQLKKKGMGNLPNASDAISSSEVSKLYADKIAGRHNPLALNNAMVINLMFLGFRGCKELYSRMLGDLKVVTIDGRKELHIAKERATKSRNGEVPKAAPFGLPKLAATGDLDCPVKAFEELKRRRPAKFQYDDSPLFLRPATTDPKSAFPVGQTWYYNSRVGINFISKMTRSMMLQADLDTTGRKITNTSCRKSMATTMIEKSYSSKSVMKQLRHTNPNSMLRYDASDVSVEKVTGDLFGKPTSKEDEPCSSKESGPNAPQQLVTPPEGHFSTLPGGNVTKIFNIQF